MDAIKFIKEKVRMCDSFAAQGQKCTGCPLAAFEGCDIDDLVDQDSVEEAVELVEKWSKENPRKTRQSEFLKQYPKVAICDGVIDIRPCKIVGGYASQYCLCDSSYCVKCRKDFWLQEIN